MKLERRSEGQSSRVAGLLVCAGGVLSCVLGCTAYPTVKPNVPIDCTADSAYDFLVIDNFETLPDTAFFASGDMSPSSIQPTATVETIPDGPRCNSKVAMLIQSAHHNDWGSVFGFSNFGPRDASAYEGVSFWARSSGISTTTFILLLDDPNSDNGAPTPTDCNADAGAAPTDAGPLTMCKKYCTPDAGVGAPVTMVVDPSTGMAIGGSTSAAPPADACGNDFQVAQVVTSDWRFYTIPFSKYQQGYMPNRVPNPLLTVTGNVTGNGLRTSAIMDFTIRLPREADAQLWFDNLQFYRPKKAGSDGGSDAPRM